MAAPRKLTSDTFYDIFSSWPAEDRAIALKVLDATHRQLCKIESRTVEPKKDATAGAAGEQERLALMATGNKAEE